MSEHHPESEASLKPKHQGESSDTALQGKLLSEARRTKCPYVGEMRVENGKVTLALSGDMRNEASIQKLGNLLATFAGDPDVRSLTLDLTGTHLHASSSLAEYIRATKILRNKGKPLLGMRGAHPDFLRVLEITHTKELFVLEMTDPPSPAKAVGEEVQRKLGAAGIQKPRDS